MKRFCSFLVLLVLLLALPLASTATSSEVFLDVRDGVLYFGSYEIPLSATDKPIAVDKDDTSIYLYVQTPDGQRSFDLGRVSLSISSGAVPYVSLDRIDPTQTPAAPASTARPTAKPTADIRQQDPCPLCGKSNYHGGHICPLCGQPFCKHDQNACLRIANPAKTPIPTKNAEGKNVTYYAAEDGSYVMGGPGSSNIWRPDSYITPSPSPTIDPMKVTPAPGNE